MLAEGASTTLTSSSTLTYPKITTSNFENKKSWLKILSTFDDSAAGAQSPPFLSLKRDATNKVRLLTILNILQALHAWIGIFVCTCPVSFFLCGWPLVATCFHLCYAVSHTKFKHSQNITWTDNSMNFEMNNVLNSGVYIKIQLETHFNCLYQIH